jgi:hypothetical protein|tara:strand:+ start:1982 stop:2101 length:120 start_codon:yes stop_codon:yes gene_type:complete
MTLPLLALAGLAVVALVMHQAQPLLQSLIQFKVTLVAMG